MHALKTFNLVRSNQKKLVQQCARSVSCKPSFLKPIVGVIGAPMSLGQPLSGTELAPAALRGANLRETVEAIGWEYYDHGDVQIPSPIVADGDLIPKTRTSMAVGQGCKLISDKMTEVRQQGHFALTLGGDHSIAVGTVSGALRANSQTRIIWVDAHADINTPLVSPSGNLHGMPLAFLMRLCDPTAVPGYDWLKDVPRLDPKNVVYIGLRDIDETEKNMIRDIKVKAFTMHAVDKYGIGKIMEMALDHLNLNMSGDGSEGSRTTPIHISFDIDSVDPTYAPATGTAVPGGLSYREAHYLVEEVAATRLLVGLDMVEVNPQLLTHAPHSGVAAQEGSLVKASLAQYLPPDSKKKQTVWKAATNVPGAISGSELTVRSAVDFIGSALGRAILP